MAAVHAAMPVAQFICSVTATEGNHPLPNEMQPGRIEVDVPAWQQNGTADVVAQTSNRVLKTPVKMTFTSATLGEVRLILTFNLSYTYIELDKNDVNHAAYFSTAEVFDAPPIVWRGTCQARVSKFPMIGKQP